MKTSRITSPSTALIAEPAARPSRRGTIIAWSIFGLIFAGLCAALAVNTMWISGVRHDSQRCLEAAALAAGKALLSDDLLKPRQFPVEQKWRLERSRDTAIQIASAYRRLQHVPPLSGDNVEFLMAASDPVPAAVRVSFGSRTGGTRFPLFLSGLTGVRTAVADQACMVRVLHVPVALRPTRQVAIPMLPVCLRDGGSTTAASSWELQIENNQGADQLAWNSEQNRVDDGPDGLPELTVEMDWRTRQRTGVCLPMQLNRQCSLEHMEQRFRRGVAAEDLATVGLSEVVFPGDVATDEEFCCDVYPLWSRMIGESRVFCIAESTEDPASDSAADQTSVPAVRLTRPVAARVMRVRRNAAGATVLTLQPCVMSTVTAVMAASGKPNRYLYDLRLQE